MFAEQRAEAECLGGTVRPGTPTFRIAGEAGAIRVGGVLVAPVTVGGTAPGEFRGPLGRLAIELRDVNYPGSTYSLTYDAARDVPEGTYLRAIERQTYDVSFARR